MRDSYNDFSLLSIEQFRLELSKLMKRLLILQEIAALAVRMNENLPTRPTNHRFGSIEKMYVEPLQPEQSGASDETSDGPFRNFAKNQKNPSLISRSGQTDKNTMSTIQEKISEVLDDWDEPELQENEKTDITTTDVLQFRRALEFVDNDFPFSASFGIASTREECIESSQQLFDRLTRRNADHVLDFELLCQIAVKPDGSTDYDKVRTMVKVCFCFLFSIAFF